MRSAVESYRPARREQDERRPQWADRRPGELGRPDAEAVRELVRAAVRTLQTPEYGRRFVNPEEIGTCLDLARTEANLRRALAALGHPAATPPMRSPVAGVGQPKG